MISKKRFISNSLELVKQYPDSCHSFYLSKIISYMGIPEFMEVDDFETINDHIENNTAKRLNVKTWYDGCSIILKYGFDHAEEELDQLSDDEYTKQYNSCALKYKMYAWQVMFEEVYKEIKKYVTQKKATN